MAEKRINITKSSPDRLRNYAELTTEVMAHQIERVTRAVTGIAIDKGLPLEERNLKVLCEAFGAGMSVTLIMLADGEINLTELTFTPKKET
jgi:hypothetical protein